MLHIPQTNLLLAAKQDHKENFLEKSEENGPAGRKKDTTERVPGVITKTTEEI